ncbi:hypothetical protein Bca4012_087526 [Brassica carinata]
MDATEPDVQEGDNVDGRALTDVPPAPEPIEEHLHRLTPSSLFGYLWGRYALSMGAISLRYCSDTHASMAKEVPPNGKAAEVFGGFSSVDELENTCCRALLNHHLELDVGIPTLGDTSSLFKTHPEALSCERSIEFSTGDGAGVLPIDSLIDGGNV